MFILCIPCSSTMLCINTRPCLHWNITFLVHLIVFISKCHQLLYHLDYSQGIYFARLIYLSRVQLTFMKIKYILYLRN